MPVRKSNVQVVDFSGFKNMSAKEFSNKLHQDPKLVLAVDKSSGWPLLHSLCWSLQHNLIKVLFLQDTPWYNDAIRQINTFTTARPYMPAQTPLQCTLGRFMFIRSDTDAMKVYDTLKFLLYKGADPNLAKYYEMRPLMKCLVNGICSPEYIYNIAKLLIDNGADSCSTNNKLINKSRLVCSAKANPILALFNAQYKRIKREWFMKLLQLVATICNVNCSEPGLLGKTTTPLDLALKLNEPEVALFLLHNGALPTSNTNKLIQYIILRADVQKDGRWDAVLKLLIPKLYHQNHEYRLMLNKRHPDLDTSSIKTKRYNRDNSDLQNKQSRNTQLQDHKQEHHIHHQDEKKQNKGITNHKIQVLNNIDKIHKSKTNLVNNIFYDINDSTHETGNKVKNKPKESSYLYKSLYGMMDYAKKFMPYQTRKT